MHRISDPRVGGTARKNLRMFKELCGEAALANAHIVTTNWNRVSKEEGDSREKELETNSNIFKPLLDAGARLSRHDRGIHSARDIMRELVRKTAITTKIQLELKDGRPLASTSAGAVLTEEMKALADKHQKEMESLKEEIGEALRERNDALKAELEEERRALQLKMAQLEEDRKRMERKGRGVHSKPSNEPQEQITKGRTKTNTAHTGLPSPPPPAQAGKSERRSLRWPSPSSILTMFQAGGVAKRSKTTNPGGSERESAGAGRLDARPNVAGEGRDHHEQIFPWGFRWIGRGIAVWSKIWKKIVALVSRDKAKGAGEDHA
jgi:regulator of replication initiation timing